MTKNVPVSEHTCSAFCQTKRRSYERNILLVKVSGAWNARVETTPTMVTNGVVTPIFLAEDKWVTGVD